MSDQVKNPKHYEVIPGVEAKDIIACVLREIPGLTAEQGWYLSNILKYRLRAGKKDSLEQDIAKADQYAAMAGAVTTTGSPAVKVSCQFLETCSHARTSECDGCVENRAT